MASKFENLVFTKIPLWLVGLFFIFWAVLAILFGSVVLNGISSQGSPNGKSSKFLHVARIPQTVEAAFKGDTGLKYSGVARRLEPGFSRRATNAPGSDDFLLLSRFDPSAQRFVAEIIDLKQGQMVHRFAPLPSAISVDGPLRDWITKIDPKVAAMSSRMMHPFLTNDGGIVFQNAGPLFAVDPCGNVKWSLGGRFHHSIEVDADGDFWVPFTLSHSNESHVSGGFLEDALAEVSPSGKLKKKISVANILESNNLSYLFYNRPYSDDPFHLNDIQPVLTDSKFWAVGDVFLSFKFLSTIMLYRPSENRVIWWKQGPWMLQHDVNIIDDHRISVFDNHARSGPDDVHVVDGDDLVVYDFQTGLVSRPFTAAFKRNLIRTPSQGRGRILEDGDIFVEETIQGRILKMDSRGVVKWQYISADKDLSRLMLGWSRFLPSKDHKTAIENARRARCS
jgi:Arylsulfotransferase (ASST)